MNTAFFSLFKQKPFFWLPTLFIFIIVFFVYLTSELENKKNQIEKQTITLDHAINDVFLKRMQKLQTVGSFLKNMPFARVQQSLDIISQNFNPNETIAIGQALSLRKDEIRHLVDDMRQKKYESFDVTPFGLNQGFSAPKNKVVIKIIKPNLPYVKRFLGKDLTSLPHFEDALNNLKNQELAKPIFFLDQGRLIATLLFNLSHKNQQHQVQLSKQYVFLFQDIETTLRNLIHQHLETQPTNATLFFKSHDEQYQNLPSQFTFIKGTSQNRLYSRKVTQIESINGSPFRLEIETRIDWSSLHFIPASIWAMLAAGLTLIFSISSLLFQNYLSQVKTKKNRQLEFLQNAHEAIISVSQTGKILDWNPIAIEMFGYRASEAIGKPIQALLFNTQSNASHTNLSHIESLPFNKTWNSSFLKKDLTPIDCRISVSRVNDFNQTHIVFFFEDISEQKRSENKIRQLAYFDVLTGLENRTFFSENVNDLLAHSGQKEGALIFLDLDGFKRVNDSLGHVVGDELLKIFAKRLQSATRKNDTNSHLCRFGGDEFIFYLHNMSLEDTIHTCKRILDLAEMPIHIKENEVQVSASLGVALFPNHSKDLNSLLRFADTAMYRAKEKGKNTYVIYESEMDEQLSQALLIERHLRTAIANNEFELFYQPQIQSKTLKVIGVEALIRWTGSELGFVPPDQFIPVSEETGQILKIGEWVAKEAINQLKRWQGTTLENTRIAINVSAQQLEQENFSLQISEWLKEAGIPPHLLEIELTERSVMSNANKNIFLFNDIRSKGLSLSVDDFGTGYSSLSYLKRFPLNILKVDKSFVDGLPGDEDDISISSAIIKLAHSLNMQVVAEGVETAEQLKFLTDLNCDMIQGYYFSKPLNATDVEKWITEHSQKHSEFTQTSAN